MLVVVGDRRTTSHTRFCQTNTILSDDMGKTGNRMNELRNLTA